jgi:hypothetical protein
MENALRFFWNGIKGSDGTLQKCSYSGSKLTSYPAGTITIYGKHYRSFSAEVAAHFTIYDASDPATDYFADETIRVTPDHPLYAQVRTALLQHEDHYEGRYKRLAEINAAREQGKPLRRAAELAAR